MTGIDSSSCIYSISTSLLAIFRSRATWRLWTPIYETGRSTWSRARQSGVFPERDHPTASKGADSIAQRVTSLELLSPHLLHPPGQGPCVFQGESVAANMLHDYLCQSPHLIHLKAFRSPVFVNNMDICNRAPYGGLDKTAPMHLTNQALNRVNTNQHQQSTIVPTVRRPVWMCRGLRTLHLEIHGSGLENNAVNSRIVFGHISVLCPVLEDLVIAAISTKSYIDETGHPHPIPLSLHLDGGLCLLTRLRSLNSLTLIDGKMT